MHEEEQEEELKQVNIQECADRISKLWEVIEESRNEIALLDSRIKTAASIQERYISCVRISHAHQNGEYVVISSDKYNEEGSGVYDAWYCAKDIMSLCSHPEKARKLLAACGLVIYKQD